MGIRRSAIVAIACFAGACSMLVDQSGLQDGRLEPDASASSSSASSGGSSSGGSGSSSSSGGSSASSGATSSGAADAATDGKVCKAINAACAAMKECCSGKCGGDRKCSTGCFDVGSFCLPGLGSCCLGAYCGNQAGSTCMPCRAAGDAPDNMATPASSSCCSGAIGNNGKCT